LFLSFKNVPFVYYIQIRERKTNLLSGIDEFLSKMKVM